MKTNQLMCLFSFLLLSSGCNKQPAAPAVTSHPTTNIIQQFGATNSVAGSETIQELEAKAKNGNLEAEYELGAKYFYGLDVTEDVEKAIEWWEIAAWKGYAAAQLRLGNCYLSGDGVAIDEKKAVELFLKAAEQDNGVAEYTLGDCYASGLGVAKDGVKATQWYGKAAESFRKSAEKGNVGAEMFLSGMYFNGKGVPQSNAEATRWLRNAAEQANSGTQEIIASWFYEGRDVPKDYAEAAKWFHEAAEKGDEYAQYNLGEMYRQGDGVPQDFVEGVKWYRRAAQQGKVNAQYYLGLAYGNGVGVPQDDVKAYVWLSLAAAQGDKDAPRLRDIVARRMSREETTEGQRQAGAFVPQKEKSGSNSNSGPSVAADSPTATGSGFFITDDGYLISNYHVVKGAAKVRVLTRAGSIYARVVKVDAANDIALLKATTKSLDMTADEFLDAPSGIVPKQIDVKYSPLPILASKSVQLGSTVATVGFPDIGLQGFAPKLAKGEIASLSGAVDNPRYFQISVPVQPGNSGGALVDERGNVIGIVSAKLDAGAALAASGALPENVNYAVKSSLLLSFLESVPAVSAKLKAPVTADRKFEDVVKSAQDAAVLVLVY